MEQFKNHTQEQPLLLISKLISNGNEKITHTLITAQTILRDIDESSSSMFFSISIKFSRGSRSEKQEKQRNYKA